MKTTHALIAAPLLLILGLFTGRELFPKEIPADVNPEPPSLSRRGERKTPRVPHSGGDETIATASDLRGLLELVDPQATFQTSTRLRASLGELGPGALENLLIQLNKDYQSDPGFYPLRNSLLNHLIAKAPFQALDMILAHEDPAFRNSSITLVIQGMARVDLEATRQAIALIEDKNVQQMARNAMLNATSDLTSEELVSLLEEGGTNPTQFVNYGFNPWINGYNNWGGYPSYFMPNTNGALAKLAKKDLAAAESHALNLETSAERESAMFQIASSLATEDPDQALEWVRNNADNLNVDQSISNILSIMAGQDPAKAISHLDEISNVQQRDSAISTIASHWGQKDPQAAIAWLDSLPASRSRLQAYSNVVHQLSTTDPRAAINLIENIPGNAQNNSLSYVLSQWVHQDFEAARNWVTTQEDPIRLQHAISNMITPWAQRDPESAAAFLDQSSANTSSSYLQHYYSQLAGQWAAQDSSAALSWASGLESDDLRNNALAGVYQRWSQANPTEVASHLTTLSNNAERQSAINALAQSWSQRDPEAAQSWLATLPPDERFQAAGSTFSTLSSFQPTVAAELYDRMTVEAGSNEDHLRSFSGYSSSIASNWSTYAPEEAAEWAQNISDENNRASAYQSIASNWSQFDLTGAAEWVDTLPAGRPRDQATQSFVQNIQRIDPAAAYDWAVTINDDSSRYSAIQQVVSQWKQTDPESARQAANNADITQEQRERLLRQLE